MTAAGTAAMAMPGSVRSSAAEGFQDWDPDRGFICMGAALKVQPVLMYTVSRPQKQRSYKSWGGIQTDEAAEWEAEKISRELHTLAEDSGFPAEIRPVIKVKTIEQADALHRRDFDVLVLYPARGGGDLLRACFSRDKDNIVFLRHRSGPVYYWYEALSERHLQTEYETDQQAAEKNKFVHVNDVVVDDMGELTWRLRALFALKNFLGTRIVALGGSWGKYAAGAPDMASEKFGMEIIDLTYDDLEKRIQNARGSQDLVRRSKAWARRYLSLPATILQTEPEFVERSFILHWIFKNLMIEHDAAAFTIKDCMSTIMPMSETTACLTLGLLNDEGYPAFCESDFVIIPPGVLLRYISGKPVFLHNSTFPHNGEVTCAHCTAPRRMDGMRYEPAVIMTHYESEYGAAPKVEMPVGQELTFLDPEYITGRWLGFRGRVKRNPFYEICRSQQDVEIIGNWQKLKNEARDSHWVAAYGDCLNECGYAARKLGLTWDNLSG